MGACESSNNSNRIIKPNQNEIEKLSPISKGTHHRQQSEVIKPTINEDIKENNIIDNNKSKSPNFKRKGISLGAQRKQSQKYCNEYRQRTIKNNNNFLVDHLVNSLNRNFNDDNTINPQKYKPEFLNDWKFIKNENTGIYYWKNYGQIPLTEELYNSIINLSLDEISKSECLYKKRIWFANYINEKIAKSKSENPILVINRNNILEDSFNQFMTTKELNLREPIQIHFVNENAHDAGGVYREWYTCLFKEFFDEKNKFFIENKNQCMNNGNYLIYPKYKDMNLDYYVFFGKLSAKSLIDKVNISELLNLTITKYILKKTVNLEDLKFYDISIYNSLKEIRDFKDINSNEFLKEIKFVWNIKDENGEIKEIELIEGGKNINLNNENKNLFIEKVIFYETYVRYEEQIEKMREGFFSLFKEETFKLFNPEEFNFQLSGQKTIDLEDWKKNTIYKGHYNENNQTIKYFWEILSELSQNDLFIFFHFCTSSSHVPIDGFNSLKGVNNKIQKFTIEPKLSLILDESKNKEFRLIEAKTCFNRILLPEYSSKEEMKKCFDIILGNDTQFFGLE